MKPENKARVLLKISVPMQAILHFLDARPQPTLVGSDFPSQRLAYNEERRFWNERGPLMFRCEDVNIRRARAR